jgi:hypothetical protein
LLYIIMPAGWSHTGDHKTAKLTKQHYIEEVEQQKKQPMADAALQHVPELSA